MTSADADGVPPVAKMSDAVEVVLARPQPDDYRFFRDDGTIRAFLSWQIDNRVFPLKGSGASGPGYFHGVFAAEHREAIEAWLRDRGLL